LKDDDAVISLAVRGATGTEIDERDAYLKAAPWKDNDNEPELPPETMAKMIAAEEFILTVCANGYGKRSSAYEYRLTKRGGRGVVNIDNIKRNGKVVASFPASNDSQVMLITDQGKLIRMNVSDVRVMGRSTAGVTLLDVAKGEKVVGVALIDEEEGPEDAAEEAVAAEIAGE
ncbi:MAG: DNA gyrase C-terminal beta-propeller domain-containing protein, partial [Pseudomonadota bacterium]